VEKVPAPGEQSDELGYVTNTYVTPAYRNQGLGRALLNALEHYARDQRMDTLIVWPSQRSVSLYRRAGFSSPAELLELPIEPSA
jgi:ribosomal protein S18 acetylase RimI-like enzyme